MRSASQWKLVGLFSVILIGLTGCGVWPVMTEENGRRPFAMGKSDQLLLPNAPQPVHLNEHYGLAYRQAKEGQILDPASANNVGPVEGPADPKGLQYSLTRYQLRYKTPPFSPWQLTGRGGGGGGRSSGSGNSGSGVGGNKK